MEHALEVLEFGQMRTRLAGHCQSELAMLHAEELEPSFDPVLVAQLQEETREASGLLGVEQLPSLQPIRDLQPEILKAAKGAILDGIALHRIGEALNAMRELRAVLKNRDKAPHLHDYAQNLPDLPTLSQRLLRSLDADGEVLDEASPELARLRKQKRNAAAKLTDRAQSYTTGASREYLSDPIVTQRGGRYVVPVKSEHRGKVRGIVHDTSSSGQTLFVEPIELVEIGNALREAEAAEMAEIARILAELSERVGAEAPAIELGLSAAATLDLCFAKARLGHQMDAIVPEEAPNSTVALREAVHPALERKSAVPLTLELGHRGIVGLLITGPNTGGKTVAIKTVGLFVLMAQSGMMVPAREAQIGFFTQVWADIGDEQSMQQSLSTFSGHIRNVSDALRGLIPGALVLLDEVGAGTDPAEGAALAKAILGDILAQKASFVASSHYGELKLFAADTPGMLNCSMEFDLKSLRPTYRLMVGTPGSSHALEIAKRCGLPGRVVESAREQTSDTEQDLSRMISQLETTQKQAIKAQSEADRLANQLRKVEQEAERKLAEAEEKSRTAKKRAAEAVEDELREIRLEAMDLFESLKKGAMTADQARAQLEKLNQRGSGLAKDLKPATEARSDVIVKGSKVRVEGYSQTGVVLEDPKSGKALIQIGAVKMSVLLSGLRIVDEALPQGKLQARKSHQLEKVTSTSPEIVLVGRRAEDAELELAKFLDDCILAGFAQIRIVHGKGEGILRQMVVSLLSRHRGVKSHRSGEATEGGGGVTIAFLK